MSGACCYKVRAQKRNNERTRGFSAGCRLPLLKQRMALFGLDECIGLILPIENLFRFARHLAGTGSRTPDRSR